MGAANDSPISKTFSKSPVSLTRYQLLGEKSVTTTLRVTNMTAAGRYAFPSSLPPGLTHHRPRASLNAGPVVHLGLVGSCSAGRGRLRSDLVLDD